MILTAVEVNLVIVGMRDMVVTDQQTRLAQQHKTISAAQCVQQAMTMIVVQRKTAIFGTIIGDVIRKN